MKELTANTTDAAVEKHVPVIVSDGFRIRVKIGEAAHPMTEEHLIQWVYAQTTEGGHRKVLKAGDAPEVCFDLTENEKLIAVYAYCNLHGLWKTEA